jgi:hypothetical protein
VHVGVLCVIVGAAVAATVACGPRSTTETLMSTDSDAPRPAPAAAAIGTPVGLPPNSEGDPPCPHADAWGKDPFGRGILVTHWTDDTAPVTVLVRTTSGADQAQRAMLGPGELRLFEFPDIDQATVSEVLIMTNTRRCYVSADPAALG